MYFLEADHEIDDGDDGQSENFIDYEDTNPEKRSNTVQLFYCVPCFIFCFFFLLFMYDVPTFRRRFLHIRLHFLILSLLNNLSCLFFSCFWKSTGFKKPKG